MQIFRVILLYFVFGLSSVNQPQKLKKVKKTKKVGPICRSQLKVVPLHPVNKYVLL